MGKGTLSVQEQKEILQLLQNRFDSKLDHHPGMDWAGVEAKLAANPEKLWSLYEMERTGGEPDLVGFDQADSVYIFMDCAAESPQGRRNLCYDRAALEARKEHKPVNSALDLAAEMGIEILTAEQYQTLQALREFDKKTSSWLKTPEKIRNLGGAIFGDRRYDTVFIYHNGAESYYAARGFRGVLRV